MTTALVANRDVAVVVTTSLLELRLQQGRITSTFVQVITRDANNVAATRRSWFGFIHSHD
jgi:hypothetical protein